MGVFKLIKKGWDSFVQWEENFFETTLRLLDFFKRYRKKDSDERLIVRCKWGNLSAFDQLIQRYQIPMQEFSYFMIGEKALDNSFSFSLFTLAFSKLKQFPLDDHFSTWMFRLTYHQCLKTLNGDENLSSCKFSLKDPILPLLGKIKMENRAVIILHDMLEIDFSDLASIFEVSPGTIRSRLHRARLDLKGLMKNQNILNVGGLETIKT